MRTTAAIATAFTLVATMAIDTTAQAAAAQSGAQGAVAAQPVLATNGDPITQWKVPFANGRSRDPFVAPDGRVFFVDQVANYLAAFDPKTAQFTKYDIPDR